MASRLLGSPKRKFLWLLVFIVSFILVVVVYHRSAHAPGQPNDKEPTASGGFNKSLYSVDQANSLWVIVDKGRQLPPNFVPSPQASNGLRVDANVALNGLFKASAKAGLPMKIISGYRSYKEQVSTYNYYVSQSGQAKTDSFSARPGHSEHQTGLAIDVASTDGKCVLEQCFGSRPAGQWLAANAYRFGFIIRYKKEQEKLTGYMYEPWHIRYVGKGLADQLRQSGQTMEQFFGLDAVTSYPSRSFILK